MELKEFLCLIKRKKQTIASVVILFFILAMILTVIQPFKYGSESKMLVVQNYTSGVDPYVASKSNEYLSSILAKIISSNYFFKEVLESGFNIENDYFYGDAEKQMKKWQKTVQARAINDTGIISISVFHKDKYQAEQINRAINYILKSRHSYYHGGGDSVIVKVIDQPVASKWIVRPNIVMNLILGILLGFILSLCFIYLFPEEKYNFRLIKKSEKKKKKEKNLSNDMLNNIQEEEPIKNKDDFFYPTQDFSPAQDNENLDRKGDMDNIFGQSGPNR